MLIENVPAKMTVHILMSIWFFFLVSEALRAAPPKYQLDLEIAKISHFFKLAQNKALRALVTKISF